MKGQTIWNAAYIRLMIFELLCQLGIALINPITSNFAVSLGATLAFAGFMAGLNPLVSLIVRPFANPVFNLASRYTLLLIAAIAFVASALICGVFPNLACLTVSRIIMGVAYVIKSSLVISLAAAAAPKDRIGQAVGWMGLAFIVSNAIGPGIGSMVGSQFGYNISFLISGFLFAAAVLMMVWIQAVHKKEAALTKAQKAASTLTLASTVNSKSISQSEQVVSSEFSSQPKRGFLRVVQSFVHIKTLPLMVITTFVSMLYGTIIALLLLAMDQRSIEGASLFFFVYAVITVISRPFSGRLNDSYGLRKVAYPEAILMCMCPLLLAFAHTLWVVVIAGVFLALGQGCLFPSLQAESVRFVTDEESSVAVNTFYIGPDIGMSFGPIIGGFIMGIFGTTAMFLFSFACGVVFIVLFFFYDSWSRKEAAKRLAIQN